MPHPQRTTRREREFEVACQTGLRVIEHDGEWLGIGTAAEIAALRADDIVPPTATDRPVELRDMV